MQWQLTCRWAYTTDPNSFHVPPRRSIRTIRNIWKNRRPLKAEAATIWPSDVSTIVEAITVITSENRSKFKYQKATKNMDVRLTYLLCKKDFSWNEASLSTLDIWSDILMTTALREIQHRTKWLPALLNGIRPPLPRLHIRDLLWWKTRWVQDIGTPWKTWNKAKAPWNWRISPLRTRVWLTLSHDKSRQFDLLAFPRSCRVLLVAFGIWHLFDWPCNSKACLRGSFAFLFHVECH